MISSNDMGNLNQSQSWLDEIHKHYNLALFSPAHSLMCIAIRSTYAGSVTMTLQCCMDSSEQLVFQYFWCTCWFRQSCFSRSFQWWALLCKFRCYEAKIDKSEKDGSCWESNPGHFWFEPPVLCCWAMTAGWQPTWKSSICSAFISSVRQDALNYYVTYASANSWHTNIHMSWLTIECSC